jgi:hypothetical protein
MTAAGCAALVCALAGGKRITQAIRPTQVCKLLKSYMAIHSPPEERLRQERMRVPRVAG